MFKLFLEGGPWMMSVLTLLLVALFFVAWKAPNWVKETGKAALAFGFLSLFMGIHQAAHFLAHANPAVDSNIIWGGMSVAMIPAMYGIIIYLISLVILVIQKPRI